MNRVLHFGLLICIILLSLHSVAQSTNKKHEPNEVITIESDTIRSPHKKLLITGFGTIPIRHFMENLSPLLTAYFSKQQINSTYEFIGNKRALLSNNLDAAIDKHQPDAVLIIYERPEGPDTLVIKQQRQYLYNLLIIPQKRQRIYNARRPKLEENLQALLWEPANNKVIWRGELHISGNAAQHNFFIKICGLLTDELRRYNLLVAEH